MFRVLKSGEEVLPSLSQRNSFDGLQDSVNSKGEVDNVAGDCLEAWDHAMRPLTLEFSERQHGLLGNTTFHAQEDEKRFEWSAM